MGLPPRLILYDNICGFCDASVQSLLQRDTEGQFHFAALQGETAAQLRTAEPAALPDDVDTVVYVDNTGAQQRILIRSRAIFAILGEIYGPSRTLRLLEALPQGLSDVVYALFAATRYRLFGKLDSCRVPTAEERDRFLD
ncbi:MAG: DCC1-like thiol-disulfide oxidoreductase family protein [Myxococcota bacterium]|nr:DCC1-like thiol-disulfide oxidoreductase family protein [Myxococcota bacterium]